jgi:2,5-diketo-D-gluconate reductase A
MQHVERQAARSAAAAATATAAPAAAAAATATAAPAATAAAAPPLALPPLPLPAVGLGTYQLRGPACAAVVAAALRAGVRHVDTAAAYRNEGDVADGLAASGVPREAVFLTSKLAPGDAGPGAYAACLASLAALRVDYLDLYLVHWPGAGGRAPGDPAQPALRRASWEALQRLHAEGRVRAIGISNFTPAHLDELCAAPWCTVRPAVNQVELHPLLGQAAILEACARWGVAVVAYASLARGADALLRAPPLPAAAAAHGVTPAQVALRWGLQRGWAVIPKTARVDRVAELSPSALLHGWALTDAEMAALDGLEAASGSLRTCWDPHVVR